MISEYELAEDAAIPNFQLLPAWIHDLRPSPTSATGSVWNSHSSLQLAFQALDASVAENMRRPTYVPDVYRANTPPPAGNEAQLGVTNRGAINNISMSTVQRTMSPQAPVEQAQQSGHTRFPSFNPTRPVGANFPQYATTSPAQSERMQSPSDQTQQRPSGRTQSASNIHAPQPSLFKPSHAFRELATPTPEAESDHQQSASVKQSPDAVKRPDPRGLMSPVQMDRPSAVPTMPSAMRNMRQPAPTMRGTMPHGFSNNVTGGGGNLTNGTHLSSFNMNSFNMPASNQHGSFTNSFSMHGSNMNGPQMNRSHLQGPQMLGSQMGRFPMSGQQMNPPQQMYNHMPGFMPHNPRMPALPTQADPFVDARPAVYAQGPFMAPNMYSHAFAAGPQPSLPAPVGSPMSRVGTAYSWDRRPQQTNHRINVPQQPQARVPQQSSSESVQQPQTKAARLAAAIRSGALAHLDPRSPPHGSRLLSPGGERRDNELLLQQPLVQPPVVRSQTVIAPEVRPDPAWVDPEDHVLPNLGDVYEHMPFVDTAADSRPCTNGVIKIGNIPYGTTKNEVIAALGRSTRIASQPKGTAYLAIHIIMERSTGKTMDVYVELDTVDEARLAITGFRQRCNNNRQPRIGDRHVEVELSSQEALMKDLFPRAKCVNWSGQTPHIYESTEAFNSGFQGFVTSEEMVMITKHAETPQRSPFALRCVNRTYETMISIMHKYPWFAVEHISIRERTAIFSCALVQLRVLSNAVSHNTHPHLLHRGLLQEYLTACLGNPGFSVQQKGYMVNCIINEGYGSLLSMIPYTPVDPMTGSWWAFEVLSKNPASSDPLLTYVVSLLSSATDPNSDFARIAAMNADITATDSAIAVVDDDIAAMSSFGHFAVKYPQQNKENCTLKTAAEAEWNALHEALSRVLPCSPAITFGEWGGQQQVAGAEEDQDTFEDGGTMALLGL